MNLRLEEVCHQLQALVTAPELIENSWNMFFWIWSHVVLKIPLQGLLPKWLWDSLCLSTALVNISYFIFESALDTESVLQGLCLVFFMDPPSLLLPQIAEIQEQLGYHKLGSTHKDHTPNNPSRDLINPGTMGTP